MPKLAEKEARGTTETVEDCCARHCLACSVYASVAAVPGKVCVALLPLSISVSSLLKGKSRNLVLCRMADECSCPHLCMFSLVTTWCHSPRLETRIKESNMRASS
jgi:hypothetical protein